MPMQRALLIASPYRGLQGPSNDVKRMEALLNTFGFTIIKCYDEDATRDGILLALKRLAEDISPKDSVVVYYSGHGGLVESPLYRSHDTKPLDIESSWRYQFLVPMDYSTSPQDGFRGILDVELSSMLRSMTDITENVTVFLDCCHAGRMVREPGLGDKAVPRSIAGIQYHDISKIANKLKSSENQPKGIYDEENPTFVCIAAAAATETAWEYRNSVGEWCGAMTEALVKVLSDCRSHVVSWRASLFRISELVNIAFPDQHPYLAGPGDRYHFSLLENTTEGLHIRNEADGAIIQAGRVSGVREGNIYSIMNHGAKITSAQEHLAEARVIEAMSFRAVVDLKFSHPYITALSEDGAIAFLKDSALPKWPVEIPSGIPWLEAMARVSNFIRPQGREECGFTLVKFRLQADIIALYTNHGIEAMRIPVNASQEDQLSLKKAVEQLARAQHLLCLKIETKDEYLHHKTQIVFGILENSTIRIIRNDGTGSIIENSYTCIQLANSGVETVYISIFNINAVGRISRVSRPTGVELPPGRKETILRRKEPPAGLQITWPKTISRDRPIEETLFFIITSSPVDFCHLATPVQSPPSDRIGLSQLEKLTWSIATGCSRNANAIEDDSNVQYSIYRITFKLMPETI